MTSKNGKSVIRTEVEEGMDQLPAKRPSQGLIQVQTDLSQHPIFGLIASQGQAQIGMMTKRCGVSQRDEVNWRNRSTVWSTDDWGLSFGDDRSSHLGDLFDHVTEFWREVRR